MRLLTSALIFLMCVAASPAQPKPVDKKPADKKPPDSLAKPPMTTSATDVSKIDGETLDQWIAKLSSPDASLRDTAVRVIPAFGAPGEKALPKIIYMMVNDPDTTVRVSAIRVATTNTVTEADKILANLTTNLNQLMGHPSSVLRLQATLAAGRLGPRGVGCTVRLCDALKDTSSYEVRRAAAASLAIVARDQGAGGPDVRAIHALLSALGDSALAVRADAIQSLITLGAPYDPSDLEGERKSVANRLGGGRETDPVQKLWLRVLLMRLDPSTIKANMPILIKELSNPKLRSNAAECLGLLGKEAKVALPELQKGVNLPDVPENLPFVCMCMWSVSQLEGDALPVLEDIKKWLNHKDQTVKNFAQDAVNRITGVKKKN